MSIGGNAWLPDSAGWFVVRAWLDTDGDEALDWSAEAPMSDYLPDPNDPSGDVAVAMIDSEMVQAVLEIAPGIQ